MLRAPSQDNTDTGQEGFQPSVARNWLQALERAKWLVGKRSGTVLHIDRLRGRSRKRRRVSRIDNRPLTLGVGAPPTRLPQHGLIVGVGRFPQSAGALSFPLWLDVGAYLSMPEYRAKASIRSTARRVRPVMTLAGSDRLIAVCDEVFVSLPAGLAFAQLLLIALLASLLALGQLAGRKAALSIARPPVGR